MSVEQVLIGYASVVLVSGIAYLVLSACTPKKRKRVRRKRK